MSRIALCFVLLLCYSTVSALFPLNLEDLKQTVRENLTYLRIASAVLKNLSPLDALIDFLESHLSSPGEFQDVVGKTLTHLEPMAKKLNDPGMTDLIGYLSSIRDKDNLNMEEVAARLKEFKP